MSSRSAVMAPASASGTLTVCCVRSTRCNCSRITRSHRRLLVGRQCVERLAELRLCDARLGQSGKPDQGPGGVVLSIVGAHAVQAAVIHQVGPLKAGLARKDAIGGHQHRPIGVR